MIYFIEKPSNSLVSKLMSGNCRNNGIEMILCDRVATGSTRGTDPRQTFTHIKNNISLKKQTKNIVNYIRLYCIFF